MEKKRHFLLAAFGIALAATSFITFTACDDDDDDDNPFVTCPGEENPYACYFLAEGSYGNNNAALIGWTGDSIVPELYYRANGRYLGDTGQDLVWLADALYVTVNGSNYVAKLDLNGRELARLDLNNGAVGSPRYISAYGPDIYVTMWSGCVARIDTATLTVQATCAAGASPEESAVVGNYLLVANSGAGNDSTVTVIDLTTFTAAYTLEIGPNPTRIVALDNGKAYCTTTTYDAAWTPTTTLHEIDTRDWSVRIIRTATGCGIRMAADGDDLLVVESATDYSSFPYQTVNSFYEYDSDDRQYEAGDFVDAAMQETLRNANIYMLDANAVTDEIFISATDYATHSAVYYLLDGHLVKEYPDAGGVNISAAAFPQWK